MRHSSVAYEVRDCQSKAWAGWSKLSIHDGTEFQLNDPSYYLESSNFEHSNKIKLKKKKSKQNGVLINKNAQNFRYRIGSKIKISRQDERHGSVLFRLVLITHSLTPFSHEVVRVPRKNQSKNYFSSRESNPIRPTRKVLYSPRKLPSKIFQTLRNLPEHLR